MVTNMNVTVKLFASLRIGRFKSEVWEMPAGSKVIDILAKLGLQGREVAILRVNGRDVPDEQKLMDGDIITLFPPMGGG